MSDCKTPQSIAQAQGDCPPAKELGRQLNQGEGEAGIATEPPRTTNPGSPPQSPDREPAQSDYMAQAQQAQRTIAEGEAYIAAAHQAMDDWYQTHVVGISQVAMPLLQEFEGLFAVDQETGIATLFSDMADFHKFMGSMATSSQSLDAYIQKLYERGNISKEDLENLRRVGGMFSGVGDAVREVTSRLADNTVDLQDILDAAGAIGRGAATAAQFLYDRSGPVKAAVEALVNAYVSVKNYVVDAVKAGVLAAFPWLADVPDLFEAVGQTVNQAVANVNATIDFTADALAIAADFFAITSGLMNSICQTINAVRQLITYMASLTKYSVLFAFMPLAQISLQLAFPQLRLPNNVTLLLTNVDGLKSQMANTLRAAACLSDALGDQGGSAAASTATAKTLESFSALRSVNGLVQKYVTKKITDVIKSFLAGGGSLASSVLAAGLEIPPGIESPTGLAWTISSKGLQRELMKRPPIAPEKGNLLSALQGVMSTISYGAKLGTFIGTLSTRLNNAWLSASYKGAAGRPDPNTELLAQAVLANELNGTNLGLGDVANAAGACGAAASDLAMSQDEKAGRNAVGAALQAGAVCLAQGNPATKPDGSNPSNAAKDVKCCENEETARKQDPAGGNPHTDPEAVQRQLLTLLDDVGGGNPGGPANQAGNNNNPGGAPPNGGSTNDDGDPDDPDVPKAPPVANPAPPPVPFPDNDYDDEGRLNVPGIDGGLARPEEAVSGSNGIRPVDLVESPFLGLPPGFYDQTQRDLILGLVGQAGGLGFDVERFLLQLLLRGPGERINLEFLLSLFRRFDAFNVAPGTPAYSLLAVATNQGLRNQSPYTFLSEGALALSSAKADGIDFGAKTLVDWLRHERLDLEPFAVWLSTVDNIDLEVPIPSGLTAEEEAVAQESFAFVRDSVELLQNVEGFILMLRKRADVYGGYNAFEHLVVLGLLHIIKAARDGAVSGELSLSETQALAMTARSIATTYLTNPELILPVLEGVAG